jgi:hypothetical protein
MPSSLFNLQVPINEGTAARCSAPLSESATKGFFRLWVIGRIAAREAKHSTPLAQASRVRRSAKNPCPLDRQTKKAGSRDARRSHGVNELLDENELRAAQLSNIQVKTTKV